MFTIEYSARTAWEAVRLLLGRGPEPPPVYQGQYDPTALKALGKKVLMYVADKMDTFVTEAVKSAGKETGKWVVRLAVWGVLGALLFKAGDAILQWIHGLRSPF